MTSALLTADSAKLNIEAIKRSERAAKIIAAPEESVSGSQDYCCTRGRIANHTEIPVLFNRTT